MYLEIFVSFTKLIPSYLNTEAYLQIGNAQALFLSLALPISPGENLLTLKFKNSRNKAIKYSIFNINWIPSISPKTHLLILSLSYYLNPNVCVPCDTFHYTLL